MKIGIICALSEEIAYYLKHVENLESHQQGRIHYWTGTYQSTELVLVQSGVGKVNAASATSLAALQEPDLIINSGSAGAIDPELKIGDIVIGTSTMYHDVDSTAFGFRLGQVDSMPESYPCDLRAIDRFQEILAQKEGKAKIVKGMIVSGDSFIASEEKVNWIRENFPEAKCTEMEATAIGQTAYVYDIPYLVIRAISDTASHDANVLFEQFIKEVGRESAKVTLEFLRKGL